MRRRLNLSDYKVDFEKIAWEEPIAGMRCKIKKYRGRQLRLVEYSKEMEPHWCEKGHIGYVIEGHLEIRFKKESYIYSAGDGIFIPSGEEHRHMGIVRSEKVKVIFVENA